jgi:hypothetical protein
LAREALTVIIRLAGQVPFRRSRLSSNVRQHHGMLKVLATFAGAAVAAKDKMHLLATSAQVRHRLSGNAQAPRLAHLPSLLSRQRFAATNLCLLMHCVQSVRGAAATRKALPSFNSGGGGGLSGYCASSSRWRVSGR